MQDYLTCKVHTIKDKIGNQNRYQYCEDLEAMKHQDFNLVLTESKSS